MKGLTLSRSGRAGLVFSKRGMWRGLPLKPLPRNQTLRPLDRDGSLRSCRLGHVDESGSNRYHELAREDDVRAKQRLASGEKMFDVYNASG